MKTSWDVCIVNCHRFRSAAKSTTPVPTKSAVQPMNIQLTSEGRSSPELAAVAEASVLLVLPLLDAADGSDETDGSLMET